MKNLTIGDRVIVRAVSALGYANERDRVVFTQQAEKPFDAVIVGLAVKYLGTYRGSHWPDHSGEHDPPHLKVTGSVTLWEVRNGMVNKPLLVRDEDLYLTDLPFTIPRRGKRIKTIYVPPPEPAPLLLTYQP